MNDSNETTVSAVLVEMTQGGDLGALVKALAAAKKKFPPITKNAKNPHLGSKFADLASLIEATETPLADAGLVVLQTHGVCGAGVIVYTQLAHEGGGWIRGAQYFSVEPAKGLSIEQVAGKASTYGRRYGYQAILGIAAEPDDDGHAVRDYREARGSEQHRDPQRQETRRQEPPKPTSNYEDRLRAAKTIDEARGIAAEVNKDQTLSQDRRAAISKLFTETKAKLATTGPTTPAQTDDLGGRM